MSRAALLTRLNAPLEIVDIQPLGMDYGQVRVDVLCSGICGAQLQEIDGFKTTGPKPHPLGHEGCGTVVAIGQGVTRVKAGDRVVMHWRKGEGIESDFPKYLVRHREVDEQIITGGKVTTFAEQVLVSENRLTPVPADTDPEFCALLGCGLSTALATLEHEARLMGGERILIVGAGGLGLCLILAAKINNAGYVCVTDINVDKAHMAAAVGADRFWMGDNLRSEKARFDVIVNTAADPRAFNLSLQMLAPSGRYIQLGQPQMPLSIVDGRALFSGRGQTIMATQGGGFNPTADIPRYVTMFERGMINTKFIVSDRITLAEINQGVYMMRNVACGRIMIHI